MQEELKRQLKDADIKFVRILWCDNANVIRAKAAHVDFLEEYIDNGVGITMAQMALPVMYDSVVPETGLGPVGEVRLMPDWSTLTMLPYVFWRPGLVLAIPVAAIYGIAIYGFTLKPLSRLLQRREHSIWSSVTAQE